MKSRLVGAVNAAIFSLSISSVAQSAVIDAYFGMNFLNSTAGSIEAQLMDITYTGGGGGTFTTTMPAFSSFTCTSDVAAGPCTGMPDFGGPISNTPTYTTTSGGDGETTRSIGQTIPINWDTSGAFPTITITGITAIAVGATWTATGSYSVGLIPGVSGSTELLSLLASPQGDIYNGFAGTPGNSLGAFTATSVSDATFGSLVGSAFGDFTFAAASPVPVPAAVWLFGSGMLGLIGIARRKKAA